MSAHKQFTSKDVIITPFSLGKKFAYTGEDIIGSNVEIDFFQGTNITSSLFEFNKPTGLINTQYQKLVYNNVKQLYYTNFIDNSNSQFFVPTSSYYTGSNNTNHRYDNFLSSLISVSRIFPTESGAELAVISIPSKCYGNYIVPKSFAFTSGSTTLYDDGNGNLLTPTDQTFSAYGSAIYGINIYGDVASSGSHVGNIIYAQGIIVLTSGSWVRLGNSATSSLDDFEIAFSSSINVFENQYKCTIRENEYNYSLNGSLLSGSNIAYSGSGISGYLGDSDTVLGFVTESYFNPYISSIGLYNEKQELMAIGKLSQPIQSSPTTDTTFLVNFDT